MIIFIYSSVNRNSGLLIGCLKNKRRKEKIMQRICPKCPIGYGIMNGETQEIPMGVPGPISLNPTINLEPYIPKILNHYKNYAIFVCRKCGFVEFFVYNS